jgi:hypothetical protein
MGDSIGNVVLFVFYHVIEMIVEVLASGLIDNNQFGRCVRAFVSTTRIATTVIFW